ncbi:MAG: SUMF1/EgtB/PvdO family nonheme iron enzyme [Komarekiella atlantica HA4396-MV6]|jgi:formylglycine-generating enzyme required for sulfatase activity|nr:SUMF1/EgtB/PvdO family nonheme iron enzyme [Komarekiella atlantica HA4396-MV6]
MAKFALLIGVSEYELGLTSLPSASRDVEALKQVLIHPEMGEFAAADVVVLTNPQRQVMERAIYTLFANRQKNDLLLFYFSGHGVKDESRNLFLSSGETSLEHGRLVTPTAVAARFLHDSMNGSKSERQVIILDCCFSGAFPDGLTVKDDGSVDVQAQLGSKGRAILTSSTSTQYSFEQEGSDLSIYTRYLVEGIEKGTADQDEDGWISADELHNYASSKVLEAAPAMTPQFYPVKEGYRIRLAKAPVDDPKLKYCKVFDQIVLEDEGEIIDINRIYLDELRNQLRLSVEEANLIEFEALEPYRQRQQKLQRYEQALSQVIKRQYPISEKDRNALKRLQNILNFRDEDVASIEEKIIGQRKPTVSVKQYPGLIKQNQAKQFEFDVVTVNAQGEETNRWRGQAEYFIADLGNGITLDMVSIPGGEFLMGSPKSELKRSDDEEPKHKVTIQPFFMGKFQVTQAQWQAVAALPTINYDLEPNPSYFKRVNRPVEQVSWLDAVEFCARLSQKFEREYRLPSEAEWEYACRAGTTTPFHFGETITTDLANYNGTYIYGSGSKGKYPKQTTDVGSFGVANAFGIYDMHGNVWEWCLDHWHDNYQSAPNDGRAWLIHNHNYMCLLRGGSWLIYPDYCRSAYRRRNLPDFNNYDIGFRVVCSPARTP